MDLVVVRNCIFAGESCFLDLRTYEVYAKIKKGMEEGILNCNTQEVMKELEDERGKQWVEFPSYSMAHVRQMYLQKLEKKEKHPIVEYGLNNYPKFLIDEKNSLINQSEYISKCHRFCEDNRCEEAFWEYYDSYTLPIAQKWCESMGITYEKQYTDG